MTLHAFLRNAGLSENQHLLIHSSFKSIREVFKEIDIQTLIQEIQKIITPDGSLIIPAFTYCFDNSNQRCDKFHKSDSCSKVGAVSEVFRKMPGVIRTSSPTHSFGIWGKACESIGEENNPTSPLGKGSPLDWLAENSADSHVFMLGTDFNSFSFGHYLEIINKVPWYDFSPWEYMGVKNIGISVDGKKELIEIPGCSKSFVNFEKYLLNNNLIERKKYLSLGYYFIKIELLLEYGSFFYGNYLRELLCPPGTCRACDSRYEMLNKTNLKL